MIYKLTSKFFWVISYAMQDAFIHFAAFVYIATRANNSDYLGKKTFSNRLFWNLYRPIIIIIEKSGGSSILFFTFDIINYHFIQSVFGHD